MKKIGGFIKKHAGKFALGAIGLTVAAAGASRAKKRSVEAMPGH